MGTKLLSLEKKWEAEGKTPAQKAKLRYYYRNRAKILAAYKSQRGGRDIWNMWIVRKVRVIEF